MCGFVGFTNTIGEMNCESILDKMMNRIIHRGPDSSGKFLNKDIAIGFRRLSIIDISEGNQPMFNENNSLVLVFNGEIYNYKYLRAELSSCGHIFKTDSDSETLLHGYEQWKEHLVEHLRGMYSFVIYDIENKSLYAARDIFGIKPFYYTEMEDSFIFGSEIKAFLEHPKFKKELNEEALGHYLSFQYSPCEETFFKNVYKLPPAHYLILKERKLTKVRYWKPNFDSTQYNADSHSIRIENVMQESVKAHKIADVEVGSFLSGGIDSSYIAKLANVKKTFTVGFDTPYGIKYNEIGYAKEFAKAIGVENISKTITPEEFWNSLPKIQYHMDEPLADPSAVALYFVSRLASESVKVVMSGEGADELFGGYRIYQEPLTLTIYDKLPFPFRRMVSAICSFLPKKRGINYLIRRGQTIEERYIGNAYIFSYKERRKLLKSPYAKNVCKPQVVCSKYYADVKNEDTVTKMQYLDINMWLAGDILLKADKMSMANSVELRVPFLDRKVMEIAAQIPTKNKVTPYATKIALRTVAEKELPYEIASRDKLGFPIPIRVWLKEEPYYNKVYESFQTDIAKRFFNSKELIKLLVNHKDGKADNSRKIWTIYTFIIWYQQYFE